MNDSKVITLKSQWQCLEELNDSDTDRFICEDRRCGHA